MVFQVQMQKKNPFSRAKSYLNIVCTWVNRFKCYTNRQVFNVFTLERNFRGRYKAFQDTSNSFSVRSARAPSDALSNLFSKCLPFPFVFTSKLSLFLTLSQAFFPLGSLYLDESWLNVCPLASFCSACPLLVVALQL